LGSTIGSGCLFHQAFELFFTDTMGNCVANLFEAREIPEVGKVSALLRFDRLHGAVVSVQEYALVIRLFLQGQALSVLPQARELLNEIELAYVLKSSETGNFGIG
jgi:hypothetical protein